MKVVIDLKDDTPLPLVLHFADPVTRVNFDKFCQRNPDYIGMLNEDGSVSLMPRWAVEANYVPSEREMADAKLEPGYYEDDF